MSGRSPANYCEMQPIRRDVRFARPYENIIMHSPIIAGLDEAGRGPLAGPVVAGACILPCEMRKRDSFGWTPVMDDDCVIGDSKQLSEEQRERAFAWITAHCAFGIGMSSAQDIDQVGILEATNAAMQKALDELKMKQEPTYLLIDGRDAFWFDYPHSSVIKGDSLEPCIAAASILAKVTRDRLMIEHDSAFPHYGFAAHKGYGAVEHFAAIEKHGPCELHRQSFLKKFFERQQVLTPSS
jgi:ribonuclease HII